MKKTTKTTEINENIEQVEKDEAARLPEINEAELKAYAAKVEKRRIAPNFWDSI